MPTRDYAALVRKQWGDEYFQPDTAYAFSNGRTFNDSGVRGGIYTTTVEADSVEVPNVGAVFQSTVFDEDVFKTEQPTTTRPSTDRSMNAGNVGAAQEGYAFTGATVTLIRGKYITGELGSFAQTGIATSFRGKAVIPAAEGSHAVTGIDANLYINLGRAVPSEYAYAITGVDATLTKGNVSAGSLAAAVGTFTVTPTDVSLTK